MQCYGVFYYIITLDFIYFSSYIMYVAIRNLFYIKSIENSVAIKIVIENHYLHRKPNTQKSFGLFDKKTNNLLGVIIYGHCASKQLKEGMFGIKEKENIYELTRLWIQDGTPKNTESFFIGQTLKQLDKEIIISFADPSAGHMGTIYQATNFYYTGLSKKSKNLFIRGKEDFNKSNFNIEDSVFNLKVKYGENSVYYIDRTRKHRYFYLNCTSKRKKELLNALQYPLLVYPKKEPLNIIYGLYDPPEWGGELKYVGQSSIGVERAKQHKKPSNLKSNSYKINWIKNLIKNEKMYQIQIIENIGNFTDLKNRDLKLNEAEIKWIEFYKKQGILLTNSTDGGEGTRGNKLTLESKEKISKKRKEWLNTNKLDLSLWETCYKRKEYQNIDNIIHKHCSDCNSFKQLDNFGKDSSSWDKLRSICKICANIRKKEHYNKNTKILSEEEWKKSYINRKDKMSKSIKDKFEKDPLYRDKLSKSKSKAIIGISTKDGHIIEFESALKAYELGKFNNTYISTSIKSGKPYKGYYWKFKKEK